MQIYNQVSEHIGKTPIVRLDQLSPSGGATILGNWNT
jgi:hypothetical protein